MPAALPGAANAWSGIEGDEPARPRRPLPRSSVGPDPSSRWQDPTLRRARAPAAPRTLRPPRTASPRCPATQHHERTAHATPTSPHPAHLAAAALVGGREAEVAGDRGRGAVVGVDAGREPRDAVLAQPLHRGAGGLGGEALALAARGDGPGEGGGPSCGFVADGGLDDADRRARRAVAGDPVQPALAPVGRLAGGLPGEARAQLHLGGRLAAGVCVQARVVEDGRQLGRVLGAQRLEGEPLGAQRHGSRPGRARRTHSRPGPAGALTPARGRSRRPSTARPPC